MIAAGFVWSLTALGNADVNPEYSIGRVAAWLIFPALLYLILVYPDGRLPAGPERGLYAASVVLVTVSFVASALFVEAYPVGTPWADCTTDCPPNAFMILDAEPRFMDVLRQVREVIAVILMIAIVSSLIRRLRGAQRQRRRQMAPVTVAGIVSCVTLAAYVAVRRAAPDSAAVTTLGIVWSLTIPAIAGAFFAGLVARRVEAGRMLERLSVALGCEPGATQLRAELATVLDDPGIEVLVPDGIPGRWRTTEGAIVFAAEATENGRAVTPIADGPSPLALLVHDRALRDDEELLHAVQALMLSWLRHAQVRRTLAGSLRQLEDSRTRLVRAADQERSRIERDLHDGAQQRLIMLRIKLSLAEELLETDPAAGRKAVGDLGGEIEHALAEVRAIAHGVYPSVLSDRGLEDALRGSVAGSVLPVHLITHRVSRQPPEIETGDLLRVHRSAAERAEACARGDRGLGHRASGRSPGARGPRRRAGIRPTPAARRSAQHGGPDRGHRRAPADRFLAGARHAGDRHGAVALSGPSAVEIPARARVGTTRGGVRASLPPLRHGGRVFSCATREDAMVAVHADPDVALEPPAWHALPGCRCAPRPSRQSAGRSDEPRRPRSAAPNSGRMHRRRPRASRAAGRSRVSSWSRCRCCSVTAGFGCFVLGEPLTGVAALAVSVLNAVLGLRSEGEPADIGGAVQRLFPVGARVLRDGVAQHVHARGLVPGDIVLVEAGEEVPADGRLFDSVTLEADESALTGERMPAVKGINLITDVQAPLADRTDMLFAGTRVIRGAGEFVVTATGPATEAGRIAGLLAVPARLRPRSPAACRG